MGGVTLVVGASGFIGGAVLRAASAVGGQRVFALAHETAPADLPGVEVVWGDARHSGLGLDPVVQRDIQASVRSIVVSIGPLCFDDGLATARDEHVVPMMNVVEFARGCVSLDAVVLVSSVLAVGVIDRRVRSDYMPPAPRHRNFYEWAKLECERILTSSGLPARIVRAAHVVGSTDGVAAPPRSIALFDLLPALAQGLPIPVAVDTRYWVAPVDLVADVVLAIAHSDAATTTAWAVDPRSPTVGRVLDVLAIRHGLRPRRLPANRHLGRLAGLVPPRWLATMTPRYVFDYPTARWDLDLRCIETLIKSGAVAPPCDLSYLDKTIDLEVARAGELG